MGQVIDAHEANEISFRYGDKTAVGLHRRESSMRKLLVFIVALATFSLIASAASAGKVKIAGAVPALRSGPPAIAQVAHSPKAVAFMGARKCVATKTSASSIAESQRRRRVCQYHSALPSAGIRELPPHHSPNLRRRDPPADVLTDLREKLSPFYSDIGRPSIDSELMLRMLIGG